MIMKKLIVSMFVSAFLLAPVMVSAQDAKPAEKAKTCCNKDNKACCKKGDKTACCKKGEEKACQKKMDEKAAEKK
jgi:hypothetical protein